MKLSQRVVLAAFVVVFLMIVGKPFLPAWLYVAAFPVGLLVYWLLLYLERRDG